MYKIISRVKIEGLIPSNRKCTINVCMNKISRDNSEQKYIHLAMV